MSVDEWRPFSPSQIKSVDNQGTWNPEDARILYQSLDILSEQSGFDQLAESIEADIREGEEALKQDPGAFPYAVTQARTKKKLAVTRRTIKSLKRRRTDVPCPRQ
jgi:hypothetical protein